MQIRGPGLRKESHSKASTTSFWIGLSAIGVECLFEAPTPRTPNNLEARERVSKINRIFPTGILRNTSLNLIQPSRNPPMKLTLADYVSPFDTPPKLFYIKILFVGCSPAVATTHYLSH